MQDATNSDIGLASVPKGIEDNATTKGTIDVHEGLRTIQKGSSLQQGTRNGDLSFLGLPGHSSLSTLEKSCRILVPKRNSSGEHQLKQWCKLLAEYNLQVEWSQEKPESASGIGGATQPIGVACVPVGLARCNEVILFTVVEQDVPPPPPVGIMRTLQAGLDLDDNGDKVIFRQFGGESSLRTLKSGHTAIRADHFDPDGWQLPEIAELCQNNDQEFATNYMSSPTCTRDPNARTTIHQQETLPQHPHAVADRGRRPRTATELQDFIRQTLPCHRLGLRVVNK